jgi:hypothetical protein
MFNIQYNFALYQQFIIKNQSILCEVHCAFNGILNRYKPCINIASSNSIQHIGHRTKRHQFGRL